MSLGLSESFNRFLTCQLSFIPELFTHHTYMDLVAGVKDDTVVFGLSFEL